MQTVDPAVSRAKFEREIEQYRKMEPTYRKMGWLLLDVAFPKVVVAFAATKVKPALLVAAVEIDFTDYDLQPPSVRFVDPFTREYLQRKNLKFAMLRLPVIEGHTRETVAGLVSQGIVVPADIIQSNGPEAEPFICLPGIREYHDNPAHTGDSWLLYRGSGEGSLVYILDKIWTYGSNPIESFLIPVQMQLQMTEIPVFMPPQAIPA